MLPVILVKYGKKSMNMIIELFLFIQPHKVKFDINNDALTKFISKKGLPPKKASCKGHRYWVKAAVAQQGESFNKINKTCEQQMVHECHQFQVKYNSQVVSRTDYKNYNIISKERKLILMRLSLLLW